MGVPSTIDDSLIEMSLSACGPLESFTRHPSMSSRGEYVLARFLSVATAQQLLHLQKMVSTLFCTYIGICRAENRSNVVFRATLLEKQDYHDHASR